ncbi:MAG: HAD family hydrolase [Halobacteriales archaeon]
MKPARSARDLSLRNVLQPGQYDFWVFDLDGTLVDVETEYAVSTMIEVGRRLGHRFDEGEAETLWYGDGHARLAVIDRYGIDPEAFWRAVHEVEDPSDRASSSYLQEDAAVVGELDVPVALVTHCQEYLTGPVLDRHDVRDWFDAVVCCTDDLGWKPDPAPVEAGISGLKVRGGDPGAMVGDSAVDVGAAQNAGLDSVHVVRHDPDRAGRCVLGDHRIESLYALRS